MAGCSSSACACGRGGTDPCWRAVAPAIFENLARRLVLREQVNEAERRKAVEHRCIPRPAGSLLVCVLTLRSPPRTVRFHPTPSSSGVRSDRILCKVVSAQRCSSQHPRPTARRAGPLRRLRSTRPARNPERSAEVRNRPSSSSGARSVRSLARPPGPPPTSRPPMPTANADRRPPDRLRRGRVLVGDDGLLE